MHFYYEIENMFCKSVHKIAYSKIYKVRWVQIKDGLVNKNMPVAESMERCYIIYCITADKRE